MNYVFDIFYLGKEGLYSRTMISASYMSEVQPVLDDLIDASHETIRKEINTLFNNNVILTVFMQVGILLSFIPVRALMRRHRKRSQRLFELVAEMEIGSVKH